MKRREFFKNMLGVTGAMAITPLILTTIGRHAFAEGGVRKKAAGTESDMLDPNDPTAKAVGYVEDAKKSPKSAGNKCSTCTLYLKTGMKNGKEIGTCALFPKKFVMGIGYCNSWAKKA